jgi:hypothetical protein
MILETNWWELASRTRSLPSHEADRARSTGIGTELPHGNRSTKQESLGLVASQFTDAFELLRCLDALRRNHHT